MKFANYRTKQQHSPTNAGTLDGHRDFPRLQVLAIFNIIFARQRVCYPQIVRGIRVDANVWLVVRCLGCGGSGHDVAGSRQERFVNLLHRERKEESAQRKVSGVLAGWLALRSGKKARLERVG